MENVPWYGWYLAGGILYCLVLMICGHFTKGKARDPYRTYIENVSARGHIQIEDYGDGRRTHYALSAWGHSAIDAVDEVRKLEKEGGIHFMIIWTFCCIIILLTWPRWLYKDIRRVCGRVVDDR